MALVPDTKAGKASFFRSKVAPWTTNATAIGTTSAAVTALDALVTAAETALENQASAEGAYRAAVGDADQAVDAMAKAGADIISAIRTKARTAGDGVYTLAQIPVPPVPAPVGPPGTPSALKATLLPNGSLDLGWECANPPGSHGTIYHVYRQLAALGEFTFVGGTGGKKFTDTAVPAGVATIVYKIQAVRSTAIGVEAEFIVRLGTGAGGGALVASVESASPKLAA